MTGAKYKIGSEDRFTEITPLAIACINNHLEIVKYLIIEQQFDIDKCIMDDFTLVELSCLYNAPDVVQFLIDNSDTLVRYKYRKINLKWFKKVCDRYILHYNNWMLRMSQRLCYYLPTNIYITLDEIFNYTRNFKICVPKNINPTIVINLDAKLLDKDVDKYVILAYSNGFFDKSLKQFVKVNPQINIVDVKDCTDIRLGVLAMNISQRNIVRTLLYISKTKINRSTATLSTLTTLLQNLPTRIFNMILDAVMKQMFLQK